MLFYGGIGGAAAGRPRIGRYVRRVDSSSLRVRLALAMASAAAIPLIVVATIATGWEEQAAADQQLALQQALAGGPGRRRRRRADPAPRRAGAGRRAPGRAVPDQAPGRGRSSATSARSRRAWWPSARSTAAGRPAVALGGSDANTQMRLSTMAAEALRRTAPGQPPPGAFLLAGERPTIVLAAAIRQPGGGLGGIAVGELDRGWLQRRLERGIAEARAVGDGGGRGRGGGRRGRRADLGRGTWPAIRPSSGCAIPASTRGTVRFASGSSEHLAGFARVPDSTWAVVVEQPTSTALASVWASRELTFVVLLGGVHRGVRAGRGAGESAGGAAGPAGARRPRHRDRRAGDDDPPEPALRGAGRGEGVLGDAGAGWPPARPSASAPRRACGRWPTPAAS